MLENLWAWIRPEPYPDRRTSKFASPKPEQVLRSRGLTKNKLDCAFQLEFVGDPVVAQLPVVENAKNHSDCKVLQSVLSEKLGGKPAWPSKAIEEKHPAGQLFQPCLTAEEVDDLFNSVDEPKPRKYEIQRSGLSP